MNLSKTDPRKSTRNTFGTNERNENALALVEDEQEDQSVDPIYKIKPGIVYPDHDPDQHWKDMVPILGMKFKDHEEMKMMLANYGNVSKARKGKEKVEEGKGKEKVVVGNKKWTKQAIKLSKSPSKKGTKRKTSCEVDKEEDADPCNAGYANAVMQMFKKQCSKPGEMETPSALEELFRSRCFRKTVSRSRCSTAENAFDISDE
ncbi:hypothetical protein Tco_0917916 [Tanacetum coccineum]